MLTGAPSSTVNWIKLLDLRILLKYLRDLVSGRLCRWLQQDQPPLKGRGGHRVDNLLCDNLFAYRCDLRLRRRNGLGHGASNGAGCASTTWPRRDQTHVTGHIAGPSVDAGETPKGLNGGLRVRPIGRLAVFVLSAGLALPLRLNLNVHHVGRAQTARLVGFVLRLLALRQGVLALRDGLARLDERSSGYTHAGRIVKGVLGPVG